MEEVVARRKGSLINSSKQAVFAPFGTSSWLGTGPPRYKIFSTASCRTWSSYTTNSQRGTFVNPYAPFIIPLLPAPFPHRQWHPERFRCGLDTVSVLSAPRAATTPPSCAVASAPPEPSRGCPSPPPQPPATSTRKNIAHDTHGTPKSFFYRPNPRAACTERAQS